MRSASTLPRAQRKKHGDASQRARSAAQDHPRASMARVVPRGRHTRGSIQKTHSCMLSFSIALLSGPLVPVAGHSAGQRSEEHLRLTRYHRTTDTSFVEHPQLSTRSGSRYTTPGTGTGTGTSNSASAAKRRGSGIARGAGPGRGTSSGGGGSLPRASATANTAPAGRGGPSVRGTRASGLARASNVARGRGRGVARGT